MKKFIALMLVAACATFCSFGCKPADKAADQPAAETTATEEAATEEAAADEAAATEEAADADAVEADAELEVEAAAE